jgi:hypothetical protein
MSKIKPPKVLTYEDLIKPIQPGEKAYQWFERQEKLKNYYRLNKKMVILKIINDWLKLSDSKKLTQLVQFHRCYYKSLPSNERSKEIIIKYFNEIEEMFHLEREYDIEKFNKYNLLYLIDLMCQTIEFKLKKTEYKIFDPFVNRLRIKKYYTIVPN